MSAEMRPSTFTVPVVGFVMPATSFKAVLLPDPFRPMMPYVRPAGTLNDTPCSAGNVSSGCRSRMRLPLRSALFSVANCFRLAYLR